MRNLQTRCRNVLKALAKDLAGRGDDQKGEGILFHGDLLYLGQKALLHGAQDDLFVIAGICALTLQIGDADLQLPQQPVCDDLLVVGDEIDQLGFVAAIQYQIQTEGGHDGGDGGVQSQIDVTEHQRRGGDDTAVGGKKQTAGFEMLVFQLKNLLALLLLFCL